MEEKQWKGMGLAIMGALFWGLSGTSVQFLENAKHINVEWLLEARLLIAGILTIVLAYIQDGKRTILSGGLLKRKLIWFTYRPCMRRGSGPYIPWQSGMMCPPRPWQAE